MRATVIHHGHEEPLATFLLAVTVAVISQARAVRPITLIEPEVLLITNLTVVGPRGYLLSIFQYFRLGTEPAFRSSDAVSMGLASSVA